MFLFAGIIAGIITGVGLSAIVIAFREVWPDDHHEVTFDVDKLIADMEAAPTLSEIERHRAAHLAAAKSVASK